MQQYAGIYLLLNYSTCFGHPSLPSPEVHTTTVVASGTDQASSNVTKFIWSRLKKLASQIVWSVPLAATAVLCTPGDGAMDARNM